MRTRIYVSTTKPLPSSDGLRKYVGVYDKRPSDAVASRVLAFCDAFEALSYYGDVIHNSHTSKAQAALKVSDLRALVKALDDAIVAGRE